MLSKDPGKVIVQAHSLGLRALVNLLRERTIKDTNHLHTEAKTKLDNAMSQWYSSLNQNRPNFSKVANLEKKLRDIELENIWITTAGYGNTELKRVRNEKQGIVGPLNNFINIFGANLRDYILLMNPLESPVVIGQQKKTIWGYVSNSLGNIPVAHGGDLPELDLADMIRSHGRELCRKSFIFGTPANDFDTYALLLIRRLARYVDYVYTDGKHGDKNFLRNWSKAVKNLECADDILRTIVDELECQYNRATTSRITPSKAVEIREKPPTKKFFVDQIEKLHTLKNKKNARVWIEYLKGLTSPKKSKLGTKDAEHLYSIVQNKARWEGIRYHNLVTDGLPQPFNIESVVLQGDQFLQSGEKTLIVKEVRVRTSEGTGRIDLAVFGRTEIPNPKKPGMITVLKPLAIFDIKTRTSFNWDILAENSKGKRKKVVPKFRVRKRVLSDDEWENIMAEIPSRIESTQLELYASGLIREYRHLTEDESVSDILKGIILLDSQFDLELNRNAVRFFANYFVDGQNIDKIDTGCNRILFRSKNPIAERAAVVIHAPKADQIEVLRSERDALQDVEIYDPFTHTERTSSQHILYLSAGSSSRPGYTASWISKYWHGLQYVKQLSSENGNVPVTMLDLAGVLQHRDLARVRLRVSSQEPEVQSFFEGIELVDIASSVEDFLFNGGNLPDVESILSDDKENRLIVVSGWQLIEGSLPPRLRPALNELERYLVQRINQSGFTTVWFLNPKPDELTSRVYRGRCLKPFWNSSPHNQFVTDIVWNLPIRPYTSTQTAPMLDNLRVVIHETKDSVNAELIEIPYLKDWSSRFWSKRSKRKQKKTATKTGRGRLPLTAQDILANPQFTKELIDDSVDLIPWLQDLWSNKFSKTRSEIQYNLEVKRTKLYGKPSPHSGIMSRMEYRPPLKRSKGRRSYVPTQSLIPKTVITHPRHYRRCRKKKRKQANKQSYRSPHEELLEFKCLREQTARNVEIRRLRQTVHLLTGQNGNWSQCTSWRNFLKEMELRIPKKNEYVEFEDLKDISTALSSNDISSQLWDSMLWIRESHLGNDLRENEREQLDILLENKPYLSNLYGNYLFTLLVAVSLKYPNLQLDQIQNLWKSVKSWHLKQIGFTLREIRDQVQHKFDVRAIWANLCKRARELLQIPIPMQTTVRYGQLILGTYGDLQECWIFLEENFDSTKLNSGVWIGQSPLVPSNSFRWTESDNRVIAEHATDMKREDGYDLFIARIHGVDYGWILTDDEWGFLGELSIIWRKRSAITRIRGLRVKPCTLPQAPETPLGIARPINFLKRVEKELQSISQLRQFIFNVQCVLGITDGMYTISFESDDETLDEQHFSRTSDILRILRRPMVEGVPLQSSSDVGAYFTWNPYEDIGYGNLQLLQPYVERRKPYVNVIVPLPNSCQELLDREPVEVGITIGHDEEVCPIVDGSFNVHGNCWRVTLDGDCTDDNLLRQFDSHLADFEIVNLMKAGGIFFEGTRYLFDVKFEEDTSSRKGYVFRESRLLARQLDMKSIPAGIFLHLDEERLVMSLSREINTVSVTLRSTISGEVVSSGHSVPPDGKLDVIRLVQAFKEETLDFVGEYFKDSEDPEERIVDFDESLDDMKRLLKDISHSK